MQLWVSSTRKFQTVVSTCGERIEVERAKGTSTYTVNEDSACIQYDTKSVKSLGWPT
jgi:hypothetical protein